MPVIPIVQQLPGHYPEGRCLILGFGTTAALIITESGKVTWWPLGDITVDWHYDAQEGEFVPDFPEEYADHSADTELWAQFSKEAFADEETDDLPEVSGELHDPDRISHRDPQG